MNEKTFLSLFSGFGGADLGAIQAGLTPMLGIEYDTDIAAVAQANGLHTLVADVCDVDYSAIAAPFWFHASPSCINASQAKQDAGETEGDMRLADAVCRAITTWQPPYFSLENVYPYRTFAAFGRIMATLRGCGYDVDYWHLNAADYGVPQTRKRLILVASRIAAVRMPIATHAETPDPMGLQRRWVSWYESTADLWADAPHTQPALWQRQRMPEYVRTMIMDGQTGSHGTTMTIRAANEPMFTQGASQYKRTLRAFIIGGGNTNTREKRPRPVRYANQPRFTVSPRTDRDRTWLDGEWRQATPRHGARWQSFPDSYRLPDRKPLAWRGVGNAVPPLLMQRVIEAQQ